MKPLTAAPAAPAPPRDLAERPLPAIGLALVAVLLFSLQDVLSKILAATLSPVEVLWGRYLAILLLLAPAVLRAPLGMLRTAQPGLQAARGVSVLGAALFFVAGLARLPLADAAAIAFASPLIVTALSIPLLGERVGPRRWAAVATGFLGVLIVVRPGSGAVGWAALYPLASAACWALSMVVTRRMRGADAPTTTLFYSTAIGFVIASLMLPAVWQAAEPRAWCFMAVTGVLSALGQYLLIGALTRGPASLVAPFSYSQMIWATLLGYLVFAAVPTAATWVGALFIVGSGLYTAHRERVTRRSARGHAG
jgi:drug/metabolite transporter (DMT)-like permease